MAKKTTIAIDLMGVIFTEGLFVTKILYPKIKNKIEYQDLKKRYVLFAIGNISPNDFWNGILPPSRRHTFERSFLDSLKMNDDVIKEIKALSQKCNLILVSEIPKEWGEYLLKKAGLKKYFDTVLLSGEIGATKPFPRIFKLTKQHIPKGNRVIFIDDAKHNVESAKKYGFESYLFSLKPDLAIKTPQVTSLTAIL